MDEYTYENVIINPTSKEANNCIGKEAYFADNPSLCLSFANNNKNCQTLVKINVGFDRPFVSKNDIRWSCIIPKKYEPKLEFVPFESEDEFIYTYNSFKTENSDPTDYMMYRNCGIWLKYIGDDTYSYQHVTKIWNNGITIGCDTEILSWKDIKDRYTFLDGTPCGKLTEVNNG